MEKNVLEWLENTCNTHYSKAAFYDKEKQYTFGETLEKAKRIGSELGRCISGPTPIAVIMSRKVETIVAYLGVIYSGHAYVPIDGNLPAYRISTILSKLNPAAIVTDCDNTSLVKSLINNIDIYEMEGLLSAEIDDEKLDEIRKKTAVTDPLYIIFTSGSTGVPKGVITSHMSLMCYIQSYSKVMNIDKTDVLGNQSPLDYIAAIRDIYIPLLTGCSTVIIPQELFIQPKALFTFMNKYMVSAVGWSVSAFTVLSKFGAFKEGKLDYLRKICFSGSIMPASCLKEWQLNLKDAKFINQYGPTEATASCTYYIVDHMVEDDEKLPIGVPYDNYKVFLLNSDLSDTRHGEIGEICISGPILALGYYNDEERTNKSFIFNPNNKEYLERMYRTGDYGRVNESGLFEFHGRKDRQVKHMGHRVELDEIEYAAGMLEGIDECSCLYNKEKEILYLFYCGIQTKREILICLKDRLPAFMLPRKIIQLENLPKLANGKIDMNKLEEEM